MADNKDNNDKRSAKARFTLHDALHLILSNWYWFLLSLLLFGLAAEYYIRRTPPVYQRTAKIQIKDSRKGTGAELAAFNDIAGVMGRHSVDNEIYVLQSRTLMAEVVKRFDLATRYTTKGRIRTSDLYGRAPMVVEFIDIPSNRGGSFTYTMDDSGNAYISNFSNASFSAKVAPGDTIKTPLGRIVMRKTKAFNRYKDKKIVVTRSTLNNAIEAYCSRLKCEIADKQSSVINITMNDEVPRRAEDVINGIIDVYEEAAIKDKQKISDITEQFISERLVALGKELEVADSEVARFKQENQLYSPEEEATTISVEIAELNRQLLSLSTELSVAEYILSEANQGGDKVELMPVFNIAGNGASSAIAQEINDYNSAVLEYQRLCNESQSNPIIDDLREELRSMHYAIVATLQAHIEGLRLQIASISKRQEATYGDMKLSPNKEKELVALMRDQSVKQELYMYLKQKAEETQITRAAADSNCRIIDRAHGSDKPISPKTWLIYTLAIIIGSVLPFLILYIRELLNTKVRSHKDIEEALSAPMLGIVPRHEGKMERSGIVVREDGRDMVSEAFRILRTNLSFMSVDNPVKVIMLTSSVPHSGKTFVASNLATTLSQAGGKVLLMDLDLRRRTLTKLMGHRNDRRGVTSYLTGAIENLKDIITHDEEHGGLDMIFSGPQPPNPTELLMSKRMADLVLSLREVYDYIIIDSVPALSVADAMVIDRYVDHTIYVVRQGNLDRRQLPDIERLHTDKRLHSMSIVFNGATITKRSYGYGYGYGYSYGYDDDLSPWRRRWRAFKRLFKKR